MRSNVFLADFRETDWAFQTEKDNKSAKKRLMEHTLGCRNNKLAN